MSARQPGQSNKKKHETDLPPAHEEVEGAGDHEVAEVHPDQELLLRLHREQVHAHRRGLLARLRGMCGGGTG